MQMNVEKGEQKFHNQTICCRNRTTTADRSDWNVSLKNERNKTEIVKKLSKQKRKTFNLEVRANAWKIHCRDETKIIR